MLGGGKFTKQNKVLSGAYINFVSTNRNSGEVYGLDVTINRGTLYLSQTKNTFGYDFNIVDLVGHLTQTTGESSVTTSLKNNILTLK